MSFIAPPDSSIWDGSESDPSDVSDWNGDPNQVDASSDPVQVGGIGNTFTTTNAPDGTINQVVLSGEGNTLFVGTGQAEIQSIGQGSLIEAVQVLGDGTKIISTGAFGAESNNQSNSSGISVNTTIEINDLSGGIYTFSVGENKKQTFKVIKE